MPNEIELRSSADHSTCTPPIVCETNINVEALKNTMIKKLLKDSPLSAKCCIFRVPKVLRRHNPKAYRPDVVSIGPFHRRGKRFQPMEKVKQWYLNHLLSVVLNIDLKTLIDKIDNIIEFEKRAREFYAEPLDHLSPNELIEMMILDGYFLLQLFHRFFSEGEYSTKDEEIGNDPMLNMACMRQYLFHDLLLLENQLPWFVLEHLYSLSGDKHLQMPLNLLVLVFFYPIEELSRNFRSYFNHLEKKPDAGYGQILHILDLARSAIVCSMGKPEDEPHSEELPATCLSKAWVKFTTAIVSQFRKPEDEPHREKPEDEPHSDKPKDEPHSEELPATCLPKALVDFITFNVFQLRKPEDEKEDLEVFKLPPATSLSEAGVKFRKSSVEGILNVKFEDGVLEIPKFGIGELTEPLFRNLVAFEQCYHGRPHQITSYVILMDNLINSSKDIDLLCDKKIINNWLSSETASQLFNDLYDDTLLHQNFYEELCIKVNTYYNTRWHRWLEKLRRDYFGNPWTTISLVAAIILLVLTILQTAYTILAYYFPR